MNIAIIGTGNVGGALAKRWSKQHQIFLGVRDKASFKGKDLLDLQNIIILSIADAVAKAEVILLAIPPVAITELLKTMGNIDDKIIIDATNAIGKTPEPYLTVYHALVGETKAEVVKCFNTTGFENMLNPLYNDTPIDLFMAGDSLKAKNVAVQLAADAGFGDCYNFGGSDKVVLLESFALSWINLAIMQGYGRNIGLKVLKR